MRKWKRIKVQGVQVRQEVLIGDRCKLVPGRKGKLVFGQHKLASPLWLVPSWLGKELSAGRAGKAESTEKRDKKCLGTLISLLFYSHMVLASFHRVQLPYHYDLEGFPQNLHQKF